MPFPVTCHACGKSFSISDDVFEAKIKGRVVTVKCKQCQTPIRVDGTKGQADAKVGPVTAENAGAAPAAKAAEAPLATTAPATPTANFAKPEVAADAPAKAAEAQAPAETKAPAPAAQPAPTPAAAKAAAPPAQAALAPETKAAPTTSATVGAGLGLRDGGAKPGVAKETPAAPKAESPARTPLGTTPRPGPTSPLGGATTPKPAAAAPRAEAAKAALTAVTDGTPTPVAAGTAGLFAVDLPGGDRELTEAEITIEFGKGTINQDTLVWREGMAEWLEIRRVPELAALLKKQAAKVAPKVEPGVPKAELSQPKSATAAAKSPAAAPTPVGRFRPRQPTLPMGVLPETLQAELQAPLTSPEDAVTKPLPEVRPIAEAPRLAEPEVKPTPKPPEAKPATELKPVPEARSAPGPRPAPEAKALPDLRRATEPRPPADKQRELLPYERPEAPAPPAPTEVKPPTRAPGAPQTLSAASVREQAAALLVRSPGDAARNPGLRAGLPRAPVPEVPMDEEPTILRPSPFAELEETPAPRGPMPTPVRDLMGRGDSVSAPKPSRPSPPPPRAPSTPVAPTPPAPPSPAPPRPPGSKPGDTYRATPEAKRSWFPEPTSDHPPAPAAPLGSSPFGVGPARPPELSPSSAFAAAANPALMSAPQAALPMSSPLGGGGASAPFPPAAGFISPTIPRASAVPAFYEMAAFQSQKRRKLIIAGVAAAVVVIVGIAIALASSGAEKPLPPAPAPEPPKTSAPATPTSPEAPAPTTDSTRSPDSAPATEPAAKSPPPSAPLPGAPGAPAAGPGGGFADMFAEGAKQAQPGGNGKFDAALAKTAVDDQLGSAGRCREPGGPTGMTRVAVTFGPSGAVSSATISDAPFAGTSVGNCITEAMKHARIKPFTGVPQTVTERVSIR